MKSLFDMQVPHSLTAEEYNKDLAEWMRPHAPPLPPPSEPDMVNREYFDAIDNMRSIKENMIAFAKSAAPIFEKCARDIREIFTEKYGRHPR
jgi:hypothetical protein